MLLYALVEAGDREAIDLYLRAEDADDALADCLRDEPEWALGAALGAIVGLVVARIADNEAGAWTFVALTLVGLLAGAIYGAVGGFRAQRQDEGFRAAGR